MGTIDWVVVRGRELGNRCCFAALPGGFSSDWGLVSAWLDCAGNRGAFHIDRLSWGRPRALQELASAAEVVQAVASGVLGSLGLVSWVLCQLVPMRMRRWAGWNSLLDQQQMTLGGRANR